MRLYSPVNAAAVVAETARRFGIDVADIAAHSRAEVPARRAAAWALRHGLDASLPEIARALGRKDHTTIIAALARAAGVRADNPAFRAETDGLVAFALALDSPPPPPQARSARLTGGATASALHCHEERIMTLWDAGHSIQRIRRETGYPLSTIRGTVGRLNIRVRREDRDRRDEAERGSRMLLDAIAASGGRFA